MPNQEQSRDGKPRKDDDRPSPDVERHAPDGQAAARDTGTMSPHSDRQPDLVSPSGVNERDHGAADDKPMGGGALNFDDGTDMVHPRGNVTGQGGSWNDRHPGDAGELGPPGAGLSGTNGPSDPDAKRGR